MGEGEITEFIQCDQVEAGPLPEKYQLQEMTTKSYPKRTERNILDTDGTLIVYNGKLTGGSKLTVDLATKHSKAFLRLDFKANSMTYCVRLFTSWLADNGIRVLNVAGSRASKDPEIYAATVKLLESMLGKVE